MDLIVTRPFAEYQRGERIADAGEVERIRASEFASHCVPVEPAAPVDPAPQT